MARVHIPVLVLAVLAGCVRNDPVARAPSVQAEARPTAIAPSAPAEGNLPAVPFIAAVDAAVRPEALLGAPVTSGENVRLADLARTPSQYAGRTIRTQGVVAAVCQAMGCWMEIRDASAQVHIRMHGHAFFIPRDARGRQAEVQATVIAPDPQGECEREARQQTGQRVASVELDATGVVLR